MQRGDVVEIVMLDSCGMEGRIQTCQCLFLVFSHECESTGYSFVSL